GVQLGHVPAAEQGADAHEGPAVRPGPLPWVLLARGAVDLFEAEEAPVDLQAGGGPYRAQPDGGRVREGAHRVNVDVHAGRGHGTSRRLSAITWWRASGISEAADRPVLASRIMPWNCATRIRARRAGSAPGRSTPWSAAAWQSTAR